MLQRTVLFSVPRGTWEHVVGQGAVLDLDPELGLQREMCMAMETKLEIQRTIKRAKLTAFLWFLKKMIIDPKIDDADVESRFEKRCIL